MNKQKLDFLLLNREGQFIEFKENLDKNFAKEIVAFSNAGGGVILLGVKDDGKKIGINITNKLKSQIIDIGRGCDPHINIDLEEKNKILIVHIKEGQNKPYSCKNGFYLKIGPNSQKIGRDEILKLSIKTANLRFDEQICPKFDWKDFDDDKFEYYLNLAHISNNLKKENILKNIKILTEDGFTNAGVLMFAKEPYKYFKSSKLRCIHFQDNDRLNILDKKEVDKGIVGNIEYAVEYLTERNPVRFEINGLKREEYPEYRVEAYREAIVNAVIHRDYFEERSDIAVEKLKNKIIINNPGGLIFPKDKFGILSMPRNRLIADLIARTYFMEKAGTGIKRIQTYSKKNGNNVNFNINEFFFVEINNVSEKIRRKSGGNPEEIY